METTLNAISKLLGGIGKLCKRGNLTSLILVLGIIILILFSLDSIFLKIGIAIEVAILISASAKTVKTAHYGVETLFEKRTGRIFKEGLALTIPFVGKIKQYSAELITYSMEGSEATLVQCKDGLELLIEGSIQASIEYKRIFDFVAIPEDTIKKGMKDAIEGGLGVIAGKEKSDDFRLRRGAVEDLINCVFTLKRRPDFYVNNPEDFQSQPPKSFKEYLEYLKKHCTEKDISKIEKLNAENWETPTKEKDGGGRELDVLSFYEQNIKRVKLMLELEESISQSSVIEKRYCLKIAVFSLAKIRYTEESRKALEKKTQVQKEMEAYEIRHTKKMVFMKELKQEGVLAPQASDDADAMVGVATKQVIAGSSIPLVNATGR